MDVTLKVELSNSVYYLVFTFDYALQEIDFVALPVSNLINIYIS